ncbi:MAG: superinfection immunity protein [Alphaproteobacteria bacterium]
MYDESGKRTDTRHLRLVRAGCYFLLGLTVFTLLNAPTDSILFGYVFFLPTMTDSSTGIRLFAALVSFFLLWIYLIPTVIAYRRWHRKVLFIFLVNLAAGWTIIAWIVSLVWALSADRTLPQSPQGKMFELNNESVLTAGIFTKISVGACVAIILAMIYIILTENGSRFDTQTEQQPESTIQ